MDGMNPLKRVPELRRLSEDHHHGLVLARRARRTGCESDASSVSLVWKEVEEKFRNVLEPHFRIEEEYIAPRMAALGEGESVDRMNRDHSALRNCVADRADRSAPTLEEFGEKLERHIRFEERELFEAVQRRFSPEDLRAIEEACSKLPARE